MIPYGEMPKWGKTARLLVNKKNRNSELCLKKLKEPSSEEDWQQQLEDQLHKPIKPNFTRHRVIVNGIDKIWCSDLIEMQQFNKWNKGYGYFPMLLDLFSKYGWIVPLKDKKGETVTEAFKTIIEEGRKQQYLWTDNGKEYYNKKHERPVARGII